MPTWWQIANWLTGAHYVHCENSANNIVRRVRYTASGRPFVVYFGSHFIWLDAPGSWKLTPLTLRDVPSNNK